MIKSQIVEASSFSQSRVEFNIPQSLCGGIKVCSLGVFGPPNPVYPKDPILGQLAVISKITLRDNGQVLSQYDRQILSLMEYKMLQKSNVKQRSVLKRVNAHNYGLVVNNGGADNTGSTQIGVGAAMAGEGIVSPRICMDKKDLTRVFTTQADTKLAVLDLRDVLGWCNAVYKVGSGVVSSYMPCHIHKNLKLSIEFAAPGAVATDATTVAQPYIIFDEVVEPDVEAAFAKGSLIGQWADMELEEVFLGGNAQSKTFLNSFYGKTLANLHIIPKLTNQNIAPLAPNLGEQSAGDDKLNVLLNQVPLIQQGGIDSMGKRAAFLLMALNGSDLSSPLGADRTVQNSPNKTNSADAVNSLYEGADNAGTYNCQSNFFSAGTLSYMAMPIQSKVESLQLDFRRSTNNDASLLFFGEVLKVESFDASGKPVIGYA
jgi:hypothetical protein